MKNNIAVLEVFLHNQPIGTLTRLQDDRNIFSFNKEYIENPTRPLLSLSFKDTLGNLLTDVKSTKTRLPPFFSNVLPEGFMRTYLAALAQVNPEREFFLLAALGHDLPGAIKIGPIEYASASAVHNKGPGAQTERTSALHFSLTGLQLKFSARWEKKGKLTIPVHGTGGSWIIKLPSPSFKGVPENEYTMMELARHIGINVPKTALVPIDHITGIPEDIGQFGPHAFAIQRFDRSENGSAIHTEDFAQIFSIYPEKKYSAASYHNLVQVVANELGTEGLEEFIRRFVFNALIGNGDMHLKNWSLLYPDTIHPQLAPAYDYVSTLPYLSGDTLALNFLHHKKFSSLTIDEFDNFAAKARLPKKVVIDTVVDTVSRFAQAWETVGPLPLDDKTAETISTHFKNLPLWAVR